MRLFYLFIFFFLISASHLSIARQRPVDNQNSSEIINKDGVENVASNGVDFAIGSSFVPTHVRQALDAGKFVYEQFLNDAGESVDESNDVLNSLVNTTAAGNGFSIDNVKNVIAGGLDHAMKSPLISYNIKKALSAGKAAFERFSRNSTSAGDKDAPLFTKDDMKTVVNGGVDFAMKSPAVPLTAKGVIAAGKALQKGFEKYNETRDLNETKKAVIDTCVESAGDITKSLPGMGLAQTGAGVAKDLLYDGKDMASTIANRSKEALGKVCSNIAKVATNTIIKRGKEALHHTAEDNSEIDTKEYETELL